MSTIKNVTLSALTSTAVNRVKGAGSNLWVFWVHGN